MSETQSTEKNNLLIFSSYMNEELISVFELVKGTGGVEKSLIIAGKALSTENLVSELIDSKIGKTVGFASGEVLQTLSLLKLAEVSHPNLIIATIGATYIQKIALAFSFVGDDDKQAALIGAYAKLIGQLIAMGLSVATAVCTEGGTLPLVVLNAVALIVCAKKADDAIISTY